MTAAHAKGHLTIRTAASLFFLSAVVELASVTTQVPWSGALRSGALVVAYHLFFVVVFLTIGIGLWSRRRWGFWTVFAGTTIYTIDRLRYLLDRAARELEILHQLRNYPQVLDAFGMAALLRLSALMTTMVVLCWLGFAAYIHRRRAYFGQS